MTLLEKIIIRFMKEEQLYKTYKTYINQDVLQKLLNMHQISIPYRLSNEICHSLHFMTEETQQYQKLKHVLSNNEMNAKFQYFLFYFLKKEIFSWLKENKIYKLLLRNVYIKKRYQNLNNLFHDAIEDGTDITSIISSYFVWYESKEGVEFWFEKNQQYQSFIYDTLIKNNI